MSVRFFTSPTNWTVSGVTRRSFKSWRLAFCAVILAASRPAAANTPPPDPVPANSLAHFAPAGTAIFAEIQGLRALEQEWSQSDWGTALSSIMMGRADEPGSGNEALMPLAKILGIDDPVAVRRELLGHRAAVVLPNWADLAHGVLLAAPEQTAAIEAALARRNLKPEAFGRARQYQLDDHNHWLATDGHVLLLGRRLGENSLYEQALRLLAGLDTHSLAGDPRFRENVAALGSGLPRGLLYFSGAAPVTATRPTTTMPTTRAAATRSATTAATTQPTTSRPVIAVAASRTATSPASQPTQQPSERWWPASWPTLIRGVVGITVDGGTIILGVRGQLDQGAPRHLHDANVAGLQALPATTLAAWAQSINFLSHYRALMQEPPSLLTLYMSYIDIRMKAAGTSLENGLLARLGQEATVVLGVIPAEEQTVRAGFDIPAFGVIVPVDRPEEVARTLDVVGGAVIDYFYFPGIRAKLKEPLRVEKATFEGTTISGVKLGEFFRTQTACPFTHTIVLSWAVTDHDIIVSTHSDHIRQILRARAGQSRRLGEKIAAAGPLDGVPPGADAVLLAQPADIAAMLDNWLDYLTRTNPAVLKPEWWRLRRERLAARVSLGFGMAGTQPTEVVVHNTLPGWPAHHRLMAGDRIVAADGTPLAADNPRASLKHLIVNRKKSSEITLTVERSGERMDVLIPLPEEPISFDPIGAIRQLGKLLRPFAAASYTVWCSPPDRFNARVMLRAAPHPATRPATRPATAPASRPATQPATRPTPATAPTTAPASPPAASARPSTAPATTRAAR